MKILVKEKKIIYGVQVSFLRSYLPYQNTIFLAFIVLEILTGNKKKWYVIFLYVHRKNLVKEKKNSWCTSEFPLLFLCIVPQCSVVLFSRARNGHGRAHLDDIGDFGETIPNFPSKY